MGYVGVSKILLVNKENYLHNWPTNKKKWRSSGNSDSHCHTFHIEITHSDLMVGDGLRNDTVFT